MWCWHLPCQHWHVAADTLFVYSYHFLKNFLGVFSFSKGKKSFFRKLLTLMCPHFFQVAVYQWKKASKLILIHYQLSENQKIFFWSFIILVQLNCEIISLKTNVINIFMYIVWLYDNSYILLFYLCCLNC